ncbi:hypothetical protein [Gemmobacter sp. 24YEA27]|uniref:hypothetical protein n=1 Tax=Gemmobacter sp. 24YEA27 TaxID=3040672 RepID=UPI0024B39A74|nr:hypothetical protein [Gemmobacter sp. 24YEA27]
MWPSGQKTRQTHFWLADDDVSAISEALQRDVPGMIWQCSHMMPDVPAHEFAALNDALKCGDESPVSRQAFAPLTPSALQFHVCRPQVLKEARDGYAPDYVFPPEIRMVRCGRMAVRWDSGDADEAFTRRLGAIWKAMQCCTLPAKVDSLSGRALSGFRIGPAMLEQARSEGLYLQANGPFCRPAARRA